MIPDLIVEEIENIVVVIINTEDIVDLLIEVIAEKMLKMIKRSITRIYIEIEEIDLEALAVDHLLEIENIEMVEIIIENKLKRVRTLKTMSPLKGA